MTAKCVEGCSIGIPDKLYLGLVDNAKHLKEMSKEITLEELIRRYHEFTHVLPY